MIHSAKQITVSALLSQDSAGTTFQYVIPPYQRGYAWNKNQWDNLFDDLSENDNGYFLGSLICILGEKNKATVIDGQQRLTTLNLLLLAIYSKLDKMLKETVNQAVMFSNKSYNKAWLNLEEFLIYNDETLKLTPSIQNNNKSDFEYLIRKIVKKDESNQPDNFGNRRIAKAFKHFSERIDTIIKKDDIKALFDFLDKVTSACVVRIDTKDETSAFILFESINNRGVPLTPMDLIKNTMISSINNKTAEETNLEWQKVVNNLSDYDVQVRYLRHFYQAFRPIGLIFSPDKGKEKITKNDLIRTYTEVIKDNAENVLAELIKKSFIYKFLSYPENIQEKDELWSKYKNKLFDLKKLGIAPAYTLLLFLFEKYSQQNFANLLDYIEKWFMIRHLTDSPATNRLDEIFIRATETQHNEYNEKSLFDELQKELPSQERIKEALLSKSLYEDNPALIRYILIYLEQQNRTEEIQVDFWAVNQKGKAIWSVEHIYPQNPKEGEWNEDCKYGLHSLGNLTLSAYNSNLSNKSFDKKAEDKDKKDNIIGFKSGNVKINDYLRNKDKWCLEYIEERGNQLRETFLKDIASMYL